MEKVKHIKNITVENFKCFEHFSAGDFGMYNIILGDNNVGKTSFLESLLFDENISQTIYNFQSLLEFKRIILGTSAYTKNPFIFFKNRFTLNEQIKYRISFTNYNIDYTIENLILSDSSIDDRNYISNEFLNLSDPELLKVTEKDRIYFRRYYSKQNFEPVSYSVPYIFSTAFYSADLVDFFSRNFYDSKSAKDSLINDLSVIIPNIFNVEIALNYLDKTPIIAIWEKNKDSFLPLPMYGDGIVRLFRIIMEVVMCKNSYICIDEIDTGIHYSRYKDFCRIVLQTAKSNNVQLFISTHNNEFLKSFKEVLEEKDFIDYQKDTKSFTLKKLPDESIKAYEYSFEQFEFAIEQENELR